MTDLEERETALGTLDGGSPTGDEDLSEYGKKVRQRIKREWRKTQELKVERDQIREERDRVLTENKQLREELTTLHSSNHERAKADREAEIQRYSEEIKNLEEDLTAAIEDGDAKKQALIQRAISKAESRQAVAEAQPVPEPKPEPQPTASPDRQPPAERKLHEAAQAFIDRNSWWDESPRGQKEAIRIQEELENEGYTYSDKMYRELEHRLRESMPALFEDDEEEEEYGKEDRSPQRGTGSPVAAPVNDRPSRRRSTSDNMTPRDRESMARYGLDPDSPKDRKSWLKFRGGGQL